MKTIMGIVVLGGTAFVVYLIARELLKDPNAEVAERVAVREAIVQGQVAQKIADCEARYRALGVEKPKCFYMGATSGFLLNVMPPLGRALPDAATKAEYDRIVAAELRETITTNARTLGGLLPRRSNV